MEPHEAVALLARPHYVLVGRDHEKCARLCECLKKYLLIRCLHFVDANKHDPLLEVYMSDGTPISTVSRTRRFIDGEVVKRSGRRCNEYLMQILFLRNSRGELRVLFRDPQRMKDKSAWSHHSAQFDFWPMSRSLGHDSIVVSFHCWDSAVKQPLERHTRERHAALLIHLGDEADQMPSSFLELLSWLVCVACFAHHGHNALKWGIRDFIDDKVTTKACWVTLASLRNSFDLLVTFLPRWLASRLRFMDYDKGDLKQLWTLLGENEKWIEILSRLQIRFRDGCLFLAAALEHDNSAVEQATSALLHLWRFKAWSDSRWCGIGPTSRSMLGCLFCGLGDLVSTIMACPSTSKYYISGFNQLSKRVLELMVLVSCSGRLSENFVALLLEDDRLPLRLPVIDETLANDQEYIANLPAFILSEFSVLCGVPARKLRSSIMERLLIQRGYLEVRLREVRQLPWSLLGPDSLAKVEELCAGEEPAEDISRKIYRLHKMGFPLGTIHEGVKLLEQCPWTTKLVEQPHASAQGLMKAHGQYGEATMLCRSMLLQSRVLFNMDVDERKHRRLQARIQKLRRFQVSRITGRHMFVKALLDSASLYKKHGHPAVNGYSKKLISDHKRLWLLNSRMEREQYEQLAQEFRLEKQDNINRQTQLLRASFQASWTKFRRRHSDGGTTLRLGLVRFSASELTDFDDFYRSDHWTKEQVEQARASALRPCEPPSEQEVSILVAMEIFQPPLALVLPWWVKVMARGRDWLGSCIFRLEFDDRCEYFKFAHACQNPLLLSACRLEPEEAVDAYVDPATCWDEVDDEGEHAFSLLWEFVSSDDDLFGQAKAVHVLLGAVHGTGSMVHAHSDWVSLGDLEAFFPAHEAEAHAIAPKPSEKAKLLKAAEPWMHHAALWDFFRDHKDIDKDIGSDGSHGGGDDWHSSSDGGSNDDLDVFGALADKRAELDAHGTFEENPFAWGVRGGQWTADHLGVAFDSYRGFAKAGLPSDFCECHRVPKSATFSIRKYQDDNCAML
jgi:hypothetical protein